MSVWRLNATFSVQDVCSEKKNGESFQVPWYFEVQRVEPEIETKRLGNWKLNWEAVIDGLQKNFGRVSGQFGLSRIWKIEIE